MPDEEHLTADQCDELSQHLKQDAESISNRAEKTKLLDLAEGYRELAILKRMLLRKVN
jgi:hypothetical protein